MILEEAQLRAPVIRNEMSLSPKQQNSILGFFQHVLDALKMGTIVEDPIERASAWLLQHGVTEVSDQQMQDSSHMFCAAITAEVRMLRMGDPTLEHPLHRKFLENIHAHYFVSETPTSNVAEHLTTFDLLCFAQELTEVPPAYADFGISLNTLLEQRLENLDQTELRELTTQVQALPQSRQLDLARYLRVLPQYIDTVGEKQDQTRTTLVELVGRFENSSAFVALEFEETRRQIQRSVHERVVSVLRQRKEETGPSGPQRDGTIARQISIIGSYIPEDKETIDLVASDTVAVLSPGGAMKFLGSIDAATLREPIPFSISRIDAIINRLCNRQSVSVSDIRFIETEIFQKVRDDEKFASFPSRDSYWEKVFSTVDAKIVRDAIAALRDSPADGGVAILAFEEALGLENTAASSDGTVIKSVPAAQQLAGFLTHIDNVYAAETQHVKMTHAVNHLRSATVHPFGTPEAADEQRQFLLLHRPSMRAEIEQRLGISLTDLPLCSQFHLLQYVGAHSLQEFDRIGAVIRGPDASPRSQEARIHLATSFLSCAKDAGHADSILRIAEADGSDEFFALYAQMADDSERMLPRLEQLVTGANIEDEYPRDTLRAKLLARPNKLLRQARKKLDASAATQGSPSLRGEMDELRSQFRHENEQVHFFRTTLQMLSGNPRDALSLVGGMDQLLEYMDGVEIQELSSAELAKDGALFAKITETIRAQCTGRSAETFAANFPKQNGTMYVLRCGDEIFSFVSLVPMSKGLHEIDWLATPEESPIPGLGQPFLAEVLKKNAADKRLYADVKPYIPASFGTLIEDANCIAFGKTNTGEQPHQYLRVRSPAPSEKYLGHSLESYEKNALIAQCEKPGLTEATVKGEHVRLVRVDYEPGRSAKDNVDAESSDGYLFSEAQEIFGNNEWVCTRFWKNTRHTSTTGGNSYVYLLEKSQLESTEYNYMMNAIGISHGTDITSSLSAPPASTPD